MSDPETMDSPHVTSLPDVIEEDTTAVNKWEESTGQDKFTNISATSKELGDLKDCKKKTKTVAFTKNIKATELTEIREPVSGGLGVQGMTSLNETQRKLRLADELGCDEDDIRDVPPPSLLRFVSTDSTDEYPTDTLRLQHAIFKADKAIQKQSQHTDIPEHTEPSGSGIQETGSNTSAGTSCDQPKQYLTDVESGQAYSSVNPEAAINDSGIEQNSCDVRASDVCSTSSGFGSGVLIEGLEDFDYPDWYNDECDAEVASLELGQRDEPERKLVSDSPASEDEELKMFEELEAKLEHENHTEDPHLTRDCEMITVKKDETSIRSQSEQQETMPKIHEANHDEGNESYVDGKQMGVKDYATNSGHVEETVEAKTQTNDENTTNGSRLPLDVPVNEVRSTLDENVNQISQEAGIISQSHEQMKEGEHAVSGFDICCEDNNSDGDITKFRADGFVINDTSVKTSESLNQRAFTLTESDTLEQGGEGNQKETKHSGTFEQGKDGDQEETKHSGTFEQGKDGDQEETKHSGTLKQGEDGDQEETKHLGGTFEQGEDGDHEETKYSGTFEQGENGDQAEAKHSGTFEQGKDGDQEETKHLGTFEQGEDGDQAETKNSGTLEGGGEQHGPNRLPEDEITIGTEAVGWTRGQGGSRSLTSVLQEPEEYFETNTVIANEGLMEDVITSCINRDIDEPATLEVEQVDAAQLDEFETPPSGSSPCVTPSSGASPCVTPPNSASPCVTPPRSPLPHEVESPPSQSPVCASEEADLVLRRSKKGRSSPSNCSSVPANTEPQASSAKGKTESCIVS